MEIIRGQQPSALKIVIYGPEGIGKSTFASQFPDVLFIDTEGSTKFMDVARTPAPSSWTMVMEQLEYVRTHPTICKTLAVDTADWAEQLCTQKVCSDHQKKGIEDFGYGKGSVYLAEEFAKALHKLGELIDRGVNVVVTAHAKMRKFEQPDELGAYDRWELKLSKASASLLKEWADMVLFANYKTFVVDVDGQGTAKGKNKAQGGRRVMYTQHHPCWDAKNRHGLKEELPFEYKEIAYVMAGSIPASVLSTPLPSTPPPPTTAQAPVIAVQEPAVPQHQELPEQPQPLAGVDYSGIPKALVDLMQDAVILPSEIQEIVAQKGYFPINTPIENYPLDFVQGVLIGAWPQVRQAIESNPNRLPF